MRRCAVPGQSAGFLKIGVGRFLWGGSFEAAASGDLPVIPSQEAQVLVNKVVVSSVHPWLSVSPVSNISGDVR